LDKTLLDEYRRRIYGPGGSRRYLSPTEFARVFGVAAKRNVLESFARSQGLVVDPADNLSGGLVVNARGTAVHVENALGVRLEMFQDAAGALWHANVSDPQIPQSLAAHVAGVAGLSSRKGIMKPRLRMGSMPGRAGVRPPASSPRALTGTNSPVAGALAPADIRTVYGISPLAPDGTGQRVALVSFDGYNPADMTTYFNTFSLGTSASIINFVGVNGATNLCLGSLYGPMGMGCVDQSCVTQTVACDPAMLEPALDIQMLSALAPGLAEIRFYMSPNTQGDALALYDSIAVDALPVVSTSWGLSEPEWGAAQIAMEEPLFDRMMIQGQSVYAAAGDKGAFDDGVTLSVDNPASQPSVTGVGGTSLSGLVSSPTERAWSGGGGGVSALHALPSYQNGVAGKASNTNRNVPDVALNADPASSPYAVYAAGGWFGVGGTSAAAPLWAAMTCAVNQQRATAGKPLLGFANDALYQLAAGTAAVFNDITSGDNGFYSAGPGYDNATGWGSFKGDAFLTEAGTLVVKRVPARVSIYPNPWDAKRDAGTPVTILPLSTGSEVKIHTLDGRWVKTVRVVGVSARWDVTDQAGAAAPPGVYFFTADGAKGKIVVLR
jgi:kumamolisin